MVLPYMKGFSLYFVVVYGVSAFGVFEVKGLFSILRVYLLYFI
jgi:hypothetical protein